MRVRQEQLLPVVDRRIRHHSLLVSLGQEGLQAVGHLGPEMRVFDPLPRAHEHQDQLKDLAKIFTLKKIQNLEDRIAILALRSLKYIGMLLANL